MKFDPIPHSDWGLVLVAVTGALVLRGIVLLVFGV